MEIEQLHFEAESGARRVSGGEPRSPYASEGRAHDLRLLALLHLLQPSVRTATGVDQKLVADQLGYGLGVNLDVYTIAGLDERWKLST